VIELMYGDADVVRWKNGLGPKSLLQIQAACPAVLSFQVPAYLLYSRFTLLESRRHASPEPFADQNLT